MDTESRVQSRNHRSRRKNQIIASAQIGMSHAQNLKEASAGSRTVVVIKATQAGVEAIMHKGESQETTLSMDLATISRQLHT